MKLGIIADTHDNSNMIEKAIGYFKKHKIKHLIHAGDLTSPTMLEYFKEFKCVFVLGNSDNKCEKLDCKCRDLGFEEMKKINKFTFEDKKFIVFHGDNVPEFRKAVSSGEYDYIIKGHTHFFEDYVRNGSHVINPGSLSHGDETTIAILDTIDDSVERVDLFE